MGGRASPDYTNRVLSRDVRAPRWVGCCALLPGRFGVCDSVTAFLKNEGGIPNEQQKSLLLEIAEAIDRRLQQRAPRGAGAPAVKRGPHWLRWLGRQMVPNIGTLLMVVVLLLTVPSLAAPMLAPSATSTSTISYQGRLADSAGNPLTGKYNLEFRIYDVPTGGVPLWTEMWTGGNAVDVSDGLFNVMLGSIDNTLASSIEGHDELYLGHHRGHRQRDGAARAVG